MRKPGTRASTTSTTATTTSQPTPSTFTDGLPLPKLFIFDLDYTLWPFWVDTHVTGSLRPVATSATSNSTTNDATTKDTTNTNTTAMRDRTGETFAFYDEVPSILAALKAHSEIKTGAASRTSAPELAREMLSGLCVPVYTVGAGHGIQDSMQDVIRDSTQSTTQPSTQRGYIKSIKAFDQLEIYPGDKKRHMRRLKEGLGIAFEDMLFFDDESRNRNVEELGVTMWLVRDGTTRVEVDKGVAEWRQRRGIGGVR